MVKMRVTVQGEMKVIEMKLRGQKSLVGSTKMKLMMKVVKTMKTLRTMEMG